MLTAIVDIVTYVIVHALNAEYPHPHSIGGEREMKEKETEREIIHVVYFRATGLPGFVLFYSVLFD